MIKQYHIKIILKKLLTHYLKYKKELLLIYKNGLAYIILDALNDFFLELFENENLSFEERYRIHWHTGGIYNTFQLWLSDEMRESPQKMSETYNMIISNNSDREFTVKPFI